MRIFLLLTFLYLTGCTTTVSVTKYKFPDTPSKFMVAPQVIVKLTPDANGNVDPKSALSTIVSNNLAAQQNSKELSDLQQWIRDTQQNIKKDGKP